MVANVFHNSNQVVQKQIEENRNPTINATFIGNSEIYFVIETDFLKIPANQPNYDKVNENFREKNVKVTKLMDLNFRENKRFKIRVVKEIVGVDVRVRVGGKIRRVST